jgi:hypothetical protein
MPKESSKSSVDFFPVRSYIFLKKDPKGSKRIQKDPKGSKRIQKDPKEGSKRIEQVKRELFSRSFLHTFEEVAKSGACLTGLSMRLLLKVIDHLRKGIFCSGGPKKPLRNGNDILTTLETRGPVL